MIDDLARFQIRQQLDLLRWFTWEHLPPDLQAVSRPCGELAEHMARELIVCAETTAGMRKLLEAKDCFVRARIAMRDVGVAMQTAAPPPHQPPEPDER